jgi:hypothetical protein
MMIILLFRRNVIQELTMVYDLYSFKGMVHIAQYELIPNIS